ncbi:hypothetical protein HQN87_03770 [Paenibacillus tritici]|jgi:uncharacterized protein YukE|uniref:Inhibitor of growth protein N-terminal histone-binding domain-containing protein n=1 Tax=Paenibacillus tritici TaxID=1873425 RepID=A0ABX2DIJ5_9BACL|nr:hypothetical protein [Paenibacillus tritici]NQX44441.1 hypothetical protein [Paenibacillus tritici]QUL53522.1 hypothetical protein KDC22_24560 [Paenibacillus tritici]
MRQALFAGLIMVVVLLSACGNNSAEPASEEVVQETVQSFYNEMSKYDEMGKSSLENFNTTLTSYSTGQATDKELQKAVNRFQDTASEIADQVNDVKISKSLPDTVQTLLRDSVIAFQSAYQLKEKASQSAVSPDVTAEEFNAMNQQADVAMLYGISKLNEARLAAGLIEPEKAVTGTVSEAGADIGKAPSTGGTETTSGK